MSAEKYQLPGSIVKYEIGDDDTQSLKKHGRVWRIVPVVYRQHFDVDKGRDLGQEVFEPREQRRIVDRPFRVFGRVPLRHGKAVRRGQPVTVNLEVGRKAKTIRQKINDARRETERENLTKTAAAATLRT